MSATEWKPPPVGAPVWVEIPATGSVAELKRFYQSVFPAWKFREGEKVEDNDSEHQVAHVKFSDDDSQGGGIVKQSKEHKAQEQPMGSGMTVYYLTDDLNATEARVRDSGGSVVSGLENDAGSGVHMNFRDPQGNRFGVYAMKPKNSSAGE